MHRHNHPFEKLPASLFMKSSEVVREIWDPSLASDLGLGVCGFEIRLPICEDHHHLWTQEKVPSQGI